MTGGGLVLEFGGVQSAQNTKSIFHLAEDFRRCVVCPLAHWSGGQLFEHPSRAFSVQPGAKPCLRQAPAERAAPGRQMGGVWGF